MKTFLEFQAAFPELFTVLNPIDEDYYTNLSSQLEIETLSFNGLLCLPTAILDGSVASNITIAGVTDQAMALYLAHVIVCSNPNYSDLAPDGLKKVESLDNKLEWDIKIDSKYSLKLTNYGTRLLNLLEKYSCERIRQEELAVLNTTHEISGVGADMILTHSNISLYPYGHTYFGGW